VATSQFSYLQMVLGYVAGYAVVAFVLLPLYYRTATTTIYGYLEQRFGLAAYRTGAWFFLLSRWVGSSLRLFLVAAILHDLVAEPFGLPFGATVLGVLALIWLYTHRGGIRAVVFTDTLQTAAMLAVLVWVLVVLLGKLGVEDTWTWLWAQPESQWFFPDAADGRNFWKQFLGGMFITITMTGLDQDMMQKNLTCRNLREAQTNMMVFSAVLVGVNLLFLALGVVLYAYADSAGISAQGDSLFAAVAMAPGMPAAVSVLFVLGLVAAAYSSADSALTALTTSFSVDILGVERMDSARAERLRRRVHVAMTGAVGLLIVAVEPFADASIIKTIFTAAGYTYGPLLGLFALGQLVVGQLVGAAGARVHLWLRADLGQRKPHRPASCVGSQKITPAPGIPKPALRMRARPLELNDASALRVRAVLEFHYVGSGSQSTQVQSAAAGPGSAVKYASGQVRDLELIWLHRAHDA
jgi:Na+/proline symporter